MDRSEQIGWAVQSRPNTETMISCRIMTVLTAVLFLIMGCGANGSKSEYGALQGIEHEERSNPISDLKIIKRNGSVFAGFPIDGGSGNTWVLLNAKYSPYYKQMPAAQFSITVTSLLRIKNMPEVSDTVIAVLETRIK